MRRSFRTRILLLVLVVGTLPLALLGAWLTGVVARSGEAVLGSRLEAALAREASTIELEWIRYRSAALDFADLPTVQRTLRAADVTNEGAPPAELREAFATLEPAIEGLALRRANGEVLWRFGRGEGEAGAFLAFGALLRATVPVADPLSGSELGSIDVLIPVNALRSTSVAAAALGAVITAQDPDGGQLLLPAPFEPALLALPRFEWNREEWIGRQRTLTEPAMILTAAAPVAPFAAPFDRAARRGTLALALAAVLAFGAAAWLTARMTLSLEHLAAAAGDVAAGQLGRRVELHSDDEVGDVARAFNAMSDSLRRTLEQLAERESLSAVNEFAGALAHEVRNPLTAIRLNLQTIEERLPHDSPLRSRLGETLEDVERLDRTVADALDTARAGRLDPQTLDLREPVRSAVRAAAGSFGAEDKSLDWRDPPEPVLVHGDGDALERATLNLLLNAGAAIEAGTGATITLTAENGEALIQVHNPGPGVPPEIAARVFEPFFTTRPGGTGLGLAVVRRIVTAHRGTIAFDSSPGQGTTVEIRLPIIAGPGTE